MFPFSLNLWFVLFFLVSKRRFLFHSAMKYKMNVIFLKHFYELFRMIYIYIGLTFKKRKHEKRKKKFIKAADEKSFYCRKYGQYYF